MFSKRPQTATGAQQTPGAAADITSAEADRFSAMTALAAPEFLSASDAVERFLARPDLSPHTIRVYRQVLAPLLEDLGPDAAAGLLDALEASALQQAAECRWAELAPASWNRNLATLNAFLRWAGRHNDPARGLGELLRLERRREPADRTRAIPYPQLERLWQRESLPLREKTLYRLLYETAGRAGEILALDVDDLDVPNKRARIRSKGGDLDFVHFASGSARLLPRLLAGRRQGPVFLTDRAAPAGTPTLGVCPVTMRARLSYRRAAALFAQHTDGLTLHQLRHSALTHLGEAGESTVLLMAKSRHRSLRTLQRYARPGPEAVAALTARHDPARRRP